MQECNVIADRIRQLRESSAMNGQAKILENKSRYSELGKGNGGILNLE